MRGTLGRSGALLLACLVAGAAPARADDPGPLPAGWPSTLKVGMDSPHGDAAALRAKAPFATRAQFLEYTSPTNNWSTWESPAGAFVSSYVRETRAHGLTPVFSYYVLKGMTGAEGPGEAATLADPHKATEYLGLLKLFFQQAGGFAGVPIVLHMEPDFWAFLQGVAAEGNAGAIPARVAATGLPELAGLADNAAGFAQAIVRLRDRYAPNVVLGWHLSNWGAGFDVRHTALDDAGIDAVATSLASYYSSFNARFDLTFVDVEEHDAGHWASLGANRAWDAGTYARQVRLLRTFNRLTSQRFVLWQIPMGNTVMRAITNTPGHWEDNHVQWLLDDPGGPNLSAYLDAGVIALIFGRGAPGDTCACDAVGDGVTDPPAWGSHSQPSYSADDDGGLLAKRVTDYVAGGERQLPVGRAAAARGMLAGVAPAPVALLTGKAAPKAPSSSAVRRRPSASRYVSLPSTRRCGNGRRIRIRMRRPVGLPRATRVAIFVDRRRVRVARGRALRAPITVRLPRRRHSLRVVVTLSDKSSVSTTRRYRAC